MEARVITVRGIVQGVGFRPFVYRLAMQFGLKGWVRNSNEAVHIHVEGDENDILQFVQAIRIQLPTAAGITALEIGNEVPTYCKSFEILDSSNISEAVTNVSPDIAVCEACMYDIKVQPHRISYPLVNCCHCGPRFSIIERLPYDRPNTTMRVFEMCEHCRREYTDPSDRRFHAQPVACNACGPHYTLYRKKNGNLMQIDTLETILSLVAEEIDSGKIFALKGIGGYNLICNAHDEEAVRSLRLLKQRDGKPFAVMFRDLTTIEHYAHLNELQKQVLTSFRRPIVILSTKKSLAPSVSVGFPTIGAMLPYMPFHYLLFNHLSCDALVFTSGNMHDVPIITDDNKAINEWGERIEGVISYNRKIYNRVDDSVLTVTNTGEPIFIRRARGYVPEPIRIEHRNFEGIFAAGAELTGTFAIGKGNEIILSQYLGDLQNYDNYQFYLESYAHFCQLFRFRPRIAVVDMHPDYHSTLFAEQLNVPVFRVQHHHAHVASVMAEHNIEDSVIGIAWDGTGMGTDGNIWGGEFLICTPASFERYSHFEYMPLPGGDRVVDEPWRTALSYTYSYWKEELFNKNVDFLTQLEEKKCHSLIEALNKNINCPLSSSAGRLFDAVAVLLGIGLVSTFHAELPMRLEMLVNPKEPFLPYPFGIKQNVVSFEPTFAHILLDIGKRDRAFIAKSFHDTLIEIGLTICKQINYEKGIKKVILSGGTFQNKYLLTKLNELLTKHGFWVYISKKIPPNDGGIALGQMYIAAHQTIK